MGERSNIKIYAGKDDAPVYLYGHWMGDSALAHVQVGLKSGRVGDPAYLARIIFSSMVKNDIDGETGYGISTTIQDNNYAILCVDGLTGEVWLESEEGDRTTHKVSRQSFLAYDSIDTLSGFQQRWTAPTVFVE
jgi:hypothetical protein